MTGQPTPRLTPIPFPRVTIDGPFWGPRLATNRDVSIKHVYRQAAVTGRLDALKLNWQPGDSFTPHRFWDSDVAKWIEAASYTLHTHPDPDLQATLDRVVDLLVGAQQPDGYLNSYFTTVEPDKRWTNLRDAHELYCAGHLMEAAVAHYEATGQRDLLETLTRYADLIDHTFGPEPGQKRGYPGHQEIELALVKLHRATGEARYLDLARFFVDERGRQPPHYFDAEATARGDDPAAYWAGSHTHTQSHRPVREQDEAVGHAVRALYLYSGMADLAAATGDRDLWAACRRLWDSVTARKLYITGGVGAHHAQERFGADYELPNASAYAETCAAIALVFFAHRMLQVEADGRYADVLERALYNNVLAGVSLSGTTFFYVNPLASDGTHHRQDFFTCACCPPNVIRLLASLGQYAYATAGDALYVHLYLGGTAQTTLAGTPVRLTVQTAYPWDGDLSLTLAPESPVSGDLMLRLPGWCADYVLAINGQPVDNLVDRGYLRLNRRWQAGDRVDLHLSMPVRRIVAHPQVAADAGQVALQRGPLVYCLEQVDHTAPVRAIRLPDETPLTARFDADLLGGTVVIEGEGVQTTADSLYTPLDQTRSAPAALKAVPYCLWDNRAAGPMTVWLPRA